jgi:hypothetical protein
MIHQLVQRLMANQGNLREQVMQARLVIHSMNATQPVLLVNWTTAQMLAQLGEAHRQAEAAAREQAQARAKAAETGRWTAMVVRRLERRRLATCFGINQHPECCGMLIC